MQVFQNLAILLTLTALISYFNHRFLGLQPIIGALVASLVLGLSLLGLDFLGCQTDRKVLAMIDQIDLGNLLLNGLLGFLLFAGARDANLSELAGRKWQIAVFTIVGTVGTAFIVAGIVWRIAFWVGHPVDFIPCLLFGALISPTDTIAVLTILRRAGAPKDLRADIAGESLFNDGIGVVMFVAVLELYVNGSQAAVSAAWILKLFLAHCMGGIALGLALGYIGCLILRRSDSLLVQAKVTLAIACGGYVLAQAIGTSGVLAVIVAAVMVGNEHRKLVQAGKSHEYLGSFWELIDQIGNAILFVIVGLEVVLVTRSIGLETVECVLVGLTAIPAVLIGRFISIGLPTHLLRFRCRFAPHSVKISTWAGLRGGLPLALAMSLPYLTKRQEHARDIILTMTYFVVIFSILIQGLTLKHLIAKMQAGQPKPDGPAGPAAP
ncbi:MAG: sodium:proton antiporter [Planctomycetes bacterium]|nr:sodium:proton antiporter [Planctomycetota bacterium]